ncbi:oligosaccharide flippase family protein [Proteus terrae]|uniref:oligosaccharide flippase family protein n=1 Tax=Proteus terrae TaxID=1574161 RepID=UPI0028893B5A|nr:oligosaccharide flippase family protein [Proteus terrae]
MELKIKKEIIGNFVSLSSINALGILIPIITMPILSRNLGMDTYGQYLLFMTILIFGHTITDYGVQYTGIRQASTYRYNNKKLSLVYVNYQTLRLFLATIYFLSSLIYSIYFLNINFTHWILYGGSLYLLGYVLTSAWLYLSIGKTKILIISSLFTKVINLLTIIFIIKNNDDVDLLIISTTLPLFISGCFLYCFIRFKLKLGLFLRPVSILPYIIKGKNVFLGVLAPNLYNSLPIIILGSISIASEFSKFAVATRIVGLITSFQDIFAKSIYPILSRDKKNHVSSLLKINTLFSLSSFLFILFFGEYSLGLFLGKDYSSNIYLLILSVSIIFLGFSNSFADGFFLPKKYDLIYRNISLRISLLSCAISFILIYHFGILGGCIAIVLARLLFSLDYFLTYHKLLKKA